MTTRSKVSNAVRMALLATTAATIALSNPLMAAEANEEENADEAEKIVIVGSRIKRTDVEGASPVTVISAEDMENEGFTTVHDALLSLTEASGSIQGEQYTNSFTPNAQMINLRGMGPGYTLVLLNGKRVADYPMPFNSQSNFFNLASIPQAAVKEIQILSGGASAIYGSDAVAGVVNVITKQDIEDITIDVRLGQTADGGGDTERFQAVGGMANDSFSWTWTFEYYHTDPIFGKDRDYLDDQTDNPGFNGVIVNTRSLLLLDAFTGYVDPGAAACDPFVDLEYSFRPGRGYYCGRDSSGDETVKSERTNYSFFNTFTYNINDTTDLTARLLYWDSEAKATGFRLWWGSPFYYYDTAADSFWYLQRIFQPSETGEQSALFNERSIDAAVSLQGVIADEYDYEVSVSHSVIDFDRERRRFKEEAVNEYFLGGAQTGFDPYFGAYPAHPGADLSRFYAPLTQTEINDLTGIDDTGAESETTTASFTISGDLFDTSAGTAQFASILEWATQSYDINLHPRLLNRTGQGWWGLTGTGGGGERDRYAFGVETLIPVAENFDVTVAARYDKYDDVTQVDGAPTYKIGLEWRPVDDLLLRATWGTTFRAPDMHYVFAAPSGFFTSVTDVYECRLANPGLTSINETIDCGNFAVPSIPGTRQGTPFLEEEEGDSLTAGFVWSPSDDFNMTFDYYKITLENQINDISNTEVMRQEADCRIGTTIGGQVVDINSAACQNALGRVNRVTNNIGNGPATTVAGINVEPFNNEKIESEGIDVSMDYSMDTEYGRWLLGANYSYVLSAYNSQSARGLPPGDWRDNPVNFDARSKFRGTVTWLKGDWAVTLLANRLGSMPNWAETGRISPWMTYNASVRYALTENASVQLSARNLLNERPPEDPTFGNAWPYFFRGQYNAIGREVFLSFNYTF